MMNLTSNLLAIYIFFYFKLIGDNIDFEQIVRHQSKLNQNKSIHWFHYMAVKERFHSSQDLRSADFYKNMDILPNGQAQRTLEDNFTTLIARSIVSYLPAFKSFSKHVPKHLKHQLTHEMSKKSEVV
uniref:Cnidarian restricted protein n=1 Tax=Clytia hemisphaerica TaxID=252671 RepID=A0A7M5VFJ2_9CNID